MIAAPPGLDPSTECNGVTAFMSGYAWSENIGWISFRGPGYGVDIDYGDHMCCPCNEDLFGYAWSENIGWITFNDAELAGCPYGTCGFWIGGLPDDPVRPLKGWARACYVFESGCSGPLDPQRGNDEGWIKFDGPDYQVNYHADIDQFKGWAWSSDFGWISFNCENENVCDESTYYVMWGNLNEFDPNLPPACDSLTAAPSLGQQPLSVLLTGQAHDQDATGTIVQYKFYTEGSCSTSTPACNTYMSDQVACEACGCNWTCLGGPIPLCMCTEPAVRDFYCTSDLDQATCEMCCDWSQTTVTSAEDTIEYTYNSPGTYCAKLSVQDDAGDWSEVPGDCADTCTQEVMVGGGGGNTPPLIDDLTANPTFGAAVLGVDFHAEASDADGAVTEFLFDFGNGDFATATAVGVQSGVCSGFITCRNLFDPPTQQECEECPMCYWDIKTCKECGAIPYMCVYEYECDDFSNQTTCEACSCSWTPDAGPPSYYEADVQYNYTEVGTFCAKVRAKDEQGAWSDIPGDCPAAATRQITVVAGTGGNQQPVCNSLTPDPSSGNSPLQVTFTGEGSDIDGTIAAYEFDFGNGDSTIAVPGGCVGGSAGCGFEMGQEECDACGCSWNPIDHNCLTMLWPDPTCSDIDNQSDCETCSRCTWEPDFASVDYTYPAAGSYCAKLRVQDDAGDWSDVPGACPETCAKSITVTSPAPNNAPTCNSLSAVPSSGDFPLQVTFTGAGSDIDGTIEAYEFDFGTGEIPTVTTSDTINYTYTSAGNYCAKLRVQDDNGDWSEMPGSCPEACAQSIVVTNPAAPNNPPNAGMSCCPAGCSQPPGVCTGYVGDIFCLRNDATDPDGEADIVYSGWNVYGWGSDPDQDCAGKCNYTPQAIGPGDYTVSLYIEDAEGLGSTTTEDFSILQDAVADFQCGYTLVGPWLPCSGFGASEGKIIYFSDYSSPSETGSSIVRRDWYFEDGTPASDVDNNATSASSFFTYVDSYSGNVTLEVEDNVGRVDSTTYGLSVRRKIPRWWNISP